MFSHLLPAWAIVLFLLPKNLGMGGDLTHYTEEKLRLRGAKPFSDLRLPVLAGVSTAALIAVSPEHRVSRDLAAEEARSMSLGCRLLLRMGPHFFPGGASALASGTHVPS